MEAFHNSPKRAECLKEVQSVLELPEMKVIKPSDTRWLSHERCVKAVKASYSAVVITIGQLSFQNTIAKPFVADLKANITSRFASSNAVVSALSIFDPRKVPKQDSVSLPTYGEESVGKLIPTMEKIERRKQWMEKKP